MALSDKNITPELLKRNPSLITHLKDEILGTYLSMLENHVLIMIYRIDTF